MELSEKLAVKRHEELRGDLKAVAKAISETGKDDPELKALLRENSQAINKFVEAIGAIGGGKNPEVKVEVNNRELSSIVSDLSVRVGQIMLGIDSRLQALESKPKPKSLKVKRGGFQGTGLITEVIIEY